MLTVCPLHLIKSELSHSSHACVCVYVRVCASPPVIASACFYPDFFLSLCMYAALYLSRSNSLFSSSISLCTPPMYMQNVILSTQTSSSSSSTLSFFPSSSSTTSSLSTIAYSTHPRRILPARPPHPFTFPPPPLPSRSSSCKCRAPSLRPFDTKSACPAHSPPRCLWYRPPAAPSQAPSHQ